MANKMKIIKIKDCSECPYCNGYYSIGEDTFTTCDKLHKQVINLDFEEDCPLENEESDNNKIINPRNVFLREGSFTKRDEENNVDLIVSPDGVGIVVSIEESDNEEQVKAKFEKAYSDARYDSVVEVKNEEPILLLGKNDSYVIIDKSACELVGEDILHELNSIRSDEKILDKLWNNKEEDEAWMDL